MTNISNLSTAQLKQILSIKEQIEALTTELNSIADPQLKAPAPFVETAPKKRRMSAAGRAAIAAGAKARWAKLKGAAVVAKPAEDEAKPKAKKDKRSSPATRAKMAAAAKARWAKAKAEGKKGL